MCREYAQKLDDKSLLVALMRDWKKLAPKGLCSNLMITVKTHKGPGKVAPRPIHACSTSVFAPAMRLISQILDKHVLRMDHILRNTDQLLSVLKNLKVPRRSVLLKLDVKDFFMSAHHSNVVQQCKKFFLKAHGVNSVISFKKSCVPNLYPPPQIRIMFTES